MSDSFPVDFYAVAATVIPVLFLAFAVEGPFIRRLRKDSEAFNKRENLSEHEREARQNRATLLALIGAITLFVGVVGEVRALQALQSLHDTGKVFVFWCVVILLFEVVAIPTLIVIRTQSALMSQTVEMWTEAFESLIPWLRPKGEAKEESNEPPAPDDLGFNLECLCRQALILRIVIQRVRRKLTRINHNGKAHAWDTGVT